MGIDRLEARRAVEALRSGVPSGAAARRLDSGQSELDARFLALLGEAERESAEGRQGQGFLLRGGFGTGKSHLLTCFEQAALDAGFAVSRLVISKETPLNDPAKMLASAVEGLKVPDIIGRGLEEVALHYRSRPDPAGREELGKRLGDGSFNSRFAATLFIYDEADDPEISDRMVRFWSGDKLAVTDIRRVLKELGHAASYPLEKTTARELALQAFAFVPLLVRAAGWRGWVLLIDEVELIGRYTRLARSRSYAELARWLGAADHRPGLVALGAITDDFAQAMLIDKGDLDEVQRFLEVRGDLQTGDLAARGMRLIQQAALLRSPDEGVLRRTYDTLRQLHASAYMWSPPDVAWPETLGSTAMRTFVRAWINAWDVRRLYPDFVEGDHPYEIDRVTTDDRAEPEPEGEGTPDDGRRVPDDVPDDDDW